MQCFLSHWSLDLGYQPVVKSNVAQHQTFRGKPSFDEKKIGEKSRFGELSMEEIQEIMDNAVPVTTKKGDKVWDDII